LVLLNISFSLIKIKSLNEKLKSEGKEPLKIDELAKEFNVEKEDIVIALDSSQQVLSIQAKIDEDDPNSQSVIDKITTIDKSDEMLDKFILKDAILSLPEKEKKIILLRYFRGKTQGEVAEILGISQVQVSRMESKIIASLKKKMT
jgi:RNA polymerase sporulation-specific sigma factor